jgi:hypothetical protein
MTTNITAANVDTELNAAADLLQKVAEDAGIDLETLPEEKVAELLHEIMGTPVAAAVEPAKTAGAETETATPAELTAADVSLELTKRAAAENIDLVGCTPEEYKAAFDLVASEMSDPSYGTKVAEAEKVAQELAHMDEMGRVAARGFYDELNKLAEDDDKGGKGDDDEGKGGKGKMAPPFGKKKDDDDKGEKKEASLRDRLVTLAKTAGTQPQPTPAKVAFLQDAAVERATQILIASGIDPATGTKLASDEEIDAAARALLKEKGYQL